MPAGKTYEPVGTQTLSGTAASVVFSSIPATYTDLVLVISAKFDATGDIRFRLNSDATSIYSFTILSGDGATATSSRASNVESGIMSSYGQVSTVLGQSVHIGHFINYANTTTFKTVLCRANNAALGTDATVNLYRSTAAINRIELARNNAFGGTWQIGSTFTLYGIKAA
jgi:hypothetical protein